MKVFFARRKSDGRFLCTGGGHSEYKDGMFPQYWTKVAYIKTVATSLNNSIKRYPHSYSQRTPIDLAKDYDIIEVDIGIGLRAEVDRLKAIEKAKLFGTSS